MNILIWILFGAITGWIATLIKPTSSGLLGNIIIGILGSFVGGYLFNLFGAAGVTGFNIYSMIVSIIGAIIVLAFVNLFRK